MLDQEEYIEQAYFFRTLAARLRANIPTQEALSGLGQEVLSTTKLPMALDFLSGELKLHGVLTPGMAKLTHYFTPFQVYLVSEAEREGGRFDFLLALEVLERDAEYRARGATRQGMFLFQFETLCRNRLGYDRGLEAVAADPIYDDDWRDWIRIVRRQIGLVDLADMVYVRSQFYVNQRRRKGLDQDASAPVLFEEKEGKIALAHHRRDPLLLFATLERQLGYPVVPRPKLVDETQQLLPALGRRVERLEARLRLIEEEQKEGVVDLGKFVAPISLDDLPDIPADDDPPTAGM